MTAATIAERLAAARLECASAEAEVASAQRKFASAILAGSTKVRFVEEARAVHQRASDLVDGLVGLEAEAKHIELGVSISVLGAEQDRLGKSIDELREKISRTNDRYQASQADAKQFAGDTPPIGHPDEAKIQRMEREIHASRSERDNNDRMIEVAQQRRTNLESEFPFLAGGNRVR